MRGGALREARAEALGQELEERRAALGSARDELREIVATCAARDGVSVARRLIGAAVGIIAGLLFSLVFV